MIPNVYSLGVSPARKLYNYDTDLISGGVDITNTQDELVNVILYASGDLSEYLKLNQQILTLEPNQKNKKVTYTLELPDDLKPGRHEIKVHISQAFSESDSNNNVKTLNSITALIFIDVPYPGKFVDGRLNINTGDSARATTFTVSLFSKGDEKINNINGNIIIKGPTNEEIVRLDTNTISLPAKDSSKITASWDDVANSGLYYAEAVINYDGEQFILRDTFYVGNKNLKISDLIFENFKLGGLAKVDVLINSFWNKDIDAVHAEIDVIDSKNVIVESFQTLTEIIPALSSKKLTGYLETKNIQIGDYDFNIKLYYDDKESERLFSSIVNADNIKLKKGLTATGNVISSGSTKNNTLTLLVIAILILIVINVFWFIVLKKLQKKIKK